MRFNRTRIDESKSENFLSFIVLLTLIFRGMEARHETVVRSTPQAQSKSGLKKAVVHLKLNGRYKLQSDGAIANPRLS